MSASWERLDLGTNADGMLVIDVDGDRHPDVIAQALPEVVWLEAEDAALKTWRRTVIGELPKTGHTNGQGYGAGDLDGDGRPEVLLAAADGIYASPIPKDPGQGRWSWVRVVARGTDEGFAVADVDGDGDGRVDVAVSEERYPGKEPDAHLWWFEASGAGPKVLFARHLLVEQYSMNNLDAGDVDGDGDVDLVTNEHKGPHLRVQVFENTGPGAFTLREIDRGKECHLGMRLYDLDADGDLDIVGHAWDDYRFLHLWRNDGPRDLPSQPGE